MTHYELIDIAIISTVH